MKTSELLTWISIVVGLGTAIAGAIVDAVRGSVPGWMFLVIIVAIVLQVVFAIKAGKGGKK